MTDSNLRLVHDKPVWVIKDVTGRYHYVHHTGYGYAPWRQSELIGQQGVHVTSSTFIPGTAILSVTYHDPTIEAYRVVKDEGGTATVERAYNVRDPDDNFCTRYAQTHAEAVSLASKLNRSHHKDRLMEELATRPLT